MRTADSGTLSVRIFVASSPSIPGMRTSMITTFGRRRSASATALAPSEASPMTRMCGARESESRSPSLTTSWSSTIRQVISEGVATGARDDMPLNGQRELLRLRRRGEAEFAAISDPVLLCKRGDLGAKRLRLFGTQVGLPGVELLIQRELLGPVLGEVREEVLARSGSQEEQVGPDAGRARVTRRAHDLPQLLGPVGDAGQDRRHPDARVDARLDKRLDRPQPLAWVSGRGLRSLPDLVVQRRDRERHGDRGAL